MNPKILIISIIIFNTRYSGEIFHVYFCFNSSTTYGKLINITARITICPKRAESRVSLKTVVLSRNVMTHDLRGQILADGQTNISKFKYKIPDGTLVILVFN